MQELERIQKIACEIHSGHKDEYCQRMSEQAESYYIDRNVNEYIQKLEFDTPIQLSNYLKKLFGEEDAYEELVKTIVVLAFKMRTERSSVKEVIRESIYNF